MITRSGEMIRRKSSVALTFVLLLLFTTRVQTVIVATPVLTDPMSVIKTVSIK